MLNFSPSQIEAMRRFLEAKYEAEFVETVQRSIDLHRFATPFTQMPKTLVGIEMQRQLARWSLHELNANNRITLTDEMKSWLADPRHVLMFHLEVAMQPNIAMLDDEIDAMIFTHLAKNLISIPLDRIALGVVHRQSFAAICEMQVYIVPDVLPAQVTLLNHFGRYYQRNFLDRVFYEPQYMQTTVCSHCGRLGNIAFVDDGGDLYCDKCIVVS